MKQPYASRAYHCYAKVNLTLEILARRSDGFHEIASLAHTINLADDLSIEAAEDLECTVKGLCLPESENLVLRAAKTFAEYTGHALAAHISLVKRIPAAAGLGGGSTDAAATLVALDALWATGVGPHVLSALASELGSDVPFFLRGGAAVLRGRGEQLEPLPPAPPTWLVIVVPRHDVPNKTAALYSALDSADFTSGYATRIASDQLAQGRPLADEHLFNAFERAARSIFPVLTDLWKEAEYLAKRPFHLSGAGPALFALARTALDARVLSRQLKQLQTPVYVARTIGRGHRPARISYPLAG